MEFTSTKAAISEVIRKRRSIFPPSYNNAPIPIEFIEEILENANWAPNHRKTEPWRFKVFREKALQRLSEYLGNWYKQNTPADLFSEKKYEKTIKKPLQSGCVIAICMQRDPLEKVPEWEEIAAVACAVQNMWLTTTSLGLGAYWSSPRSIIEAKEFLGLKKGETCMGLFYIGSTNETRIEGTRKPIAEKVTWINE